MRLAAAVLYRFNLLRFKGSPDPLNLKTVLERLDEDIDVEAVFNVLANAKQEKSLAKISEIQTDWRREWEADRGEALKGIRAARGFLKPFLTHDECPTSRKYNATLDELTQLIKKVEFPPGPKRRKKPGNQPEPWIDKARTALQRLGVSKDLANELLAAVGLKKFTTSTSPSN
jgi:hypothetical protein